MDFIISFCLVSIMITLWMIFFKMDSITEVTIIKEAKNERFRNRVRRVSPKPVSTHVMGRSNAHHHNRLSDEQASATDHKAKDWIERPNECINAKCIARCSRADYEFYKCTFKDDAKKCPGYREGIYRDDLPLGTFKPAKHYMCDMIVNECEDTFCSDISKVSKEELDRINANIEEQQERAYKCIKQSRQEQIESLKKELNETKVMRNYDRNYMPREKPK